MGLYLRDTIFLFAVMTAFYNENTILPKSVSFIVVSA